MQQILGTGLSGLVGSRIVELLGDKYEFINLDLNSGVDITNQQLSEQKISASNSEVLIHLAAFTDVDRAWEDKGNQNGLCYKVNVIGTRNIAKACRKFNKYLIHVSTDFVFDGKKRKPYVETDPPHALEWYGETKMLAEEEVKKAGCRAVILRIAYPFKAKAAPSNLEPKVKLDLVRKIIGKLKAGETLGMYFDQIFTPAFIDDIAGVVDYGILNRPLGIYHCVGSTFISPYDFASLIAEVFGFDKTLIRKTTVKEAEGKNFRPRQIYLAIANDKLKKDFKINMSGIKESLVKIKEQSKV